MSRRVRALIAAGVVIALLCVGVAVALRSQRDIQETEQVTFEPRIAGTVCALDAHRNGVDTLMRAVPRPRDRGRLRVRWTVDVEFREAATRATP